MVTAVYPGSFDPATYGHLDVIRRASVSFDRVVVGVLHNSSKSPLFSVEERVNILEKATKDIPNVIIKPFDGLSVNFARENHAQVIVRGLRAVTDFEYELQMAQTNRVLAPDVDTIFLTTSLEYAYVSSTIMKEVARFGGDLSNFAPPKIVTMNGCYWTPIPEICGYLIGVPKEISYQKSLSKNNCDVTFFFYPTVEKEDKQDCYLSAFSITLHAIKFITHESVGNTCFGGGAIYGQFCRFFNQWCSLKTFYFSSGIENRIVYGRVSRSHAVVGVVARCRF